jgi:hypothetical protein
MLGAMVAALVVVGSHAGPGAKWVRGQDNSNRIQCKQGDCENGEGTCTWTRMEGTYTGSFVGGKRSGHGVLKQSHKRYTGDWLNDQQHGNGREEMSSGETYAGEYVEGRREGQGNYTFLDGRKYTGGWLRDRQEGHGLFTWASGRMYNGTWKAGRQSGFGTTEDHTGTYEGNWEDGVKSGHGVWVDKSMMEKYDGDFVNGQFEGHGVFTFMHGGTYEGEWVNGDEHGYGVEMLMDNGGEGFAGLWNKRKQAPNPEDSEDEVAAHAVRAREAAEIARGKVSGTELPFIVGVWEDIPEEELQAIAAQEAAAAAEAPAVEGGGADQEPSEKAEL